MSLIARYKLDGNARDSEGTAHGTAIDVTWAPSQLVDGGGEARLNGTTSRIDTGIQFTTGTAASLPIWFRPREGVGHLIGQHDGTDGLAIEQTETGKIRLVVNGTASSEVTVYPGEYHHAVAVYDAGEATLYLDNEAVATVTETVTWPAVPVTIGARADSSAALVCDVVDVRGYDQALNSTQVASLSASLEAELAQGVIPDDALIHYTMEDISGDTLIDKQDNVNGTIYGAVPGEPLGRRGMVFDGQDDFIALPSTMGGHANFAVSMVVEFDEPLSSTVNGYTFYSSSDLFFRFSPAFGILVWANRNGTGDIMYVAPDYIPPVGVPVHLLFQIDGQNNAELYYDNEPVGFTTNISNASLATANANIGRDYRDQDHTNGAIDNFYFFERTLTPDERLGLATERSLLGRFPHPTYRSMKGQHVPVLGWNPNITGPSIPNPAAIPRSGRSSVQGISALLAPPAWFDQRDGSGGSHLSPAGVVSRPDRQGMIEGTTTDHNGQPVSRRVRCFERRTGRIVRETWSNAAGDYRFTDLDPNKRFTIVAHDYAGEYNAVIADNAQPEVPA